MALCTAEACRREIKWATTRKGKAIPLDVDPQRRVVLLRPDCPADPNDPCSCPGPGHAAVATIVNTYTPHHATCPAAESFRRPA